MLAFKWFYQQITVLSYFLSLIKSVISITTDFLKFNSLPIHNTDQTLYKVLNLHTKRRVNN